MTPHPKTVQSIELQGEPARTAPPPLSPTATLSVWLHYPCGCGRRSPEAWTLCTYHEGYEDALDVSAPPALSASAVLDWMDADCPGATVDDLDRVRKALSGAYARKIKQGGAE